MDTVFAVSDASTEPLLSLPKHTANFGSDDEMHSFIQRANQVRAEGDERTLSPSAKLAALRRNASGRRRQSLGRRDLPPWMSSRFRTSRPNTANFALTDEKQPSDMRTNLFRAKGTRVLVAQ